VKGEKGEKGDGERREGREKGDFSNGSTKSDGL
jgi:hypothetical protein